MKKAIQISLMIMLFVATGCSSSKKVVAVKKADPLVGNWAMVIKGTPQGDLPAKMIISKDESNSYSGVLSTTFGDLPLENFKIGNNKLSAGFAAQGLDFSLTGTFKGKDFEGAVSGMGEIFTANGKKE